mgnify:FL=1
MDTQCRCIRLYSAQDTPVLRALEKHEVCFSKAAYVERKYGESAPIFMTAYSWFVQEAEKRVAKPSGAEFPYWAFPHVNQVDLNSDRLLVLDVPSDQVLYFDMYDWIKVLQLSYLARNEKEEQVFHEKLALHGVTSTQVMLSPFFLDLKQEIYQSWERLFRHHEALAEGKNLPEITVQTALWQIKKEWIVT